MLPADVRCVLAMAGLRDSWSGIHALPHWRPSTGRAWSHPWRKACNPSNRLVPTDAIAAGPGGSPISRRMQVVGVGVADEDQADDGATSVVMGMRSMHR